MKSNTCPKCKAKYRLWHTCQQTEKHFEKWVGLHELVERPFMWGKKFTDKEEWQTFRQNPPDNALVFGFLAQILHELKESNRLAEKIYTELKKEG